MFSPLFNNLFIYANKTPKKAVYLRINKDFFNFFLKMFID